MISSLRKFRFNKPVEKVEKELVEEIANQSNSNYISVVEYLNKINLALPLRFTQQIGKIASKICREKDIKKDFVFDDDYGRVGTYPEYVLKNAMNIFFAKDKFKMDIAKTDKIGNLIRIEKYKKYQNGADN